MVFLVRSKGVVDVSLKVNGQMGDPEDGTGNMNQTLHQFAFTLNTNIQTENIGKSECCSFYITKDHQQ